MRRIFLIGFMGCGKSTWGRKLSGFMGLSFIDLDRYIEEKMCMAVPDIFEERGEDAFREIERMCLQEVAEIENVIISTGGGAPCFFDNMDLMNAKGLTIYMNLQPKTLVKRLTKSKNKRPLVEGKTGEELLQYIVETLKHRGVFYQRAKLSVDPKKHTLESMAESIKTAMI